MRRALSFGSPDLHQLPESNLAGRHRVEIATEGDQTVLTNRPQMPIGHQIRGCYHAEAAIKTFAKLYGVKFPKAVKKITDDQDQLLAFYDFPAEHWIHLRTTDVIVTDVIVKRCRSQTRIRCRVSLAGEVRPPGAAVVQLTTPVWSGTYKAHGMFTDRDRDGYNDYADAIPILFTTLERLPPQASVM
jgi:hypothetical protein